MKCIPVWKLNLWPTAYVIYLIKQYYILHIMMTILVDNEVQKLEIIIIKVHMIISQVVLYLLTND